MNKFQWKSAALFAGLLSLSAQAIPRVAVHLARLKYNDYEVTEKLFLRPLLAEAVDPSSTICDGKSEVKSFSLSEAVIEIHCRSTKQDLLNSLQDPETAGIFFIGHPGKHWKIDSNHRKISANSFLMDSADVAIPKEIFSAAHRNLQFVSVSACDGTALKDSYLRFANTGVTRYYFHEGAKNSASNSEFLHMFLWPRMALSEWEAHRADFKNYVVDPETRRRSVEISYRDLYSHAFGYSVFLDDKLVGFLSPASERSADRQRVTIPIRERDWLDAQELRIKVDLEERATYAPKGQKIFDDILVDSINAFSSGTALHLGDNDQSAETTNGNPRNQEEIIAVSPTTEVVISRDRL